MSTPAPSPAPARDLSPGWPRAALLSLSDKTGALAFASALAGHGTRLIASGGTARHLREAGLEVTAVETWTGFEELLGGRVKTLHPHVHAPILARRDRAEDLAELGRRGIEPIDLVAVTLYPFESEGVHLDDAGMIEEIDIGGVALLRGAAKNHDGVLVVQDPTQYDDVLAALARGVTAEDRRRLALAAFTRTARYDAAIAGELARRLSAPGEPPPVHALVLERSRTLRYGENPHQAAALYARGGALAALDAWREGKELSYNNLLDLEAAVALAGRFPEPACVVVKHNQPCGAATGPTLAEACARALASDPLSAFGGIVAFNRPLDDDTAAALGTLFLECVAFPDITPEADARLRTRRNLRLVRWAPGSLPSPEVWSLRPVGPWALLQADSASPPPPWRVVTSRAPDEEELRALRFAWPVCDAARSNAIVLARGTQSIGLGSGQTSRVDAVDVALLKAARSGHDVRGAVLASDGFFPFPDSVTRAAAAGIRAVVQPGGSVRDDEVIAEADRAGIAMMFTDRRVFRH